MNTNNTLTTEKSLMKYKTDMVHMVRTPHKQHSSSLVVQLSWREFGVHTNNCSTFTPWLKILIQGLQAKEITQKKTLCATAKYLHVKATQLIKQEHK